MNTDNNNNQQQPPKRPNDDNPDNAKTQTVAKKPRKKRKSIEETQCGRCKLFGHIQSSTTKCKLHPNYKGKADSASPVADNKKEEGLDADAFVHVCFDIETSGLSSKHHEIIEIFCQTIHGRKKTMGNSFHSFIKPTKSVGDSHLIHGITDDDPQLSGAEGFKEVATKLMTFIEAEIQKFQESDKTKSLQAVLVACNGNAFDVPFLLKQLEHHNVPLSPTVIGQWDPFLIIKNMAFSPIPKDKSLGTMFRSFGWTVNLCIF